MDKKCLTCYFQKSETPGNLDLITVNGITNQRIPQCCYEIASNNVKKYFEDIREADKSVVKAVILSVCDFENKLFKSNSDFYCFIIKTFKKNKISYRFIDKRNFNLTLLLINAKLSSKLNDSILVIFVSDSKISVEEVHKTADGYEQPPLKETQAIQCPDECNFEKIKAEIFANRKKPAKIILAAITKYSEKIWKNLMKVFKGKNAIFIESISTMDQDAAVSEIAAHLLDEKRNEYYIIPRYSFLVRNTTLEFTCNIQCDLTKGLPFKETHLDQRRHHGQYYIQRYYQDQKESESVQMYPNLVGQYHKAKLTLFVDKNMIPSLTQEPYIDPSIEQLPTILTDKVPSKIPVIGFFNNSSVICLWNEKEKCYKFSSNWNGLYGEDLYISFDEEKPKYRNAAFHVLKEKPSFVVYELLYTMASKSNNVWINPSWSFVITKDEENPILLEFDNFDGTRKFATPEFLMALLLKDHLKAIKEETGTKPAEVGIVFFDKNDKRKCKHYSVLKERIQESCDLLKIRCEIVDIDD